MLKQAGDRKLTNVQIVSISFYHYQIKPNFSRLLKNMGEGGGPSLRDSVIYGPALQGVSPRGVGALGSRREVPRFPGARQMGSAAVA